MTFIRPNVLSARQQLAQGFTEFHERHSRGSSGVELCAAISDLRDEILRNLVLTAIDDLKLEDLWSQISLVLHGGSGRRDVAPFSDVDLMILHEPEAKQKVALLAERLLRDVFDVGLVLGNSVRTPAEACQLAREDVVICTALTESRLLIGSESLFDRYLRSFRRQIHKICNRLLHDIITARRKEQIRYGETVFLLEPNIKRSRGGLRDFQLIRWIGFLRYGTADIDKLHALDALNSEDFEAVKCAYEFLLTLRNELHFHTRQATDILDRAEQVRIADLRGYKPEPGLLPVEQFMRDYFRHTSALGHTASRFIAQAENNDRLARLSTMFLGHRIEKGLYVGPGGIVADRHTIAQTREDLTAIMRLVDLANLYDKPIAVSTWETIRRNVRHLPDTPPSSAACRYFLSLLSHPARLGTLLRELHEAHLLERFIPEFQPARGLLQFNQYHKYTVDEHCIRAVEVATGFLDDKGPLGRVYRILTQNQKRILHLALLIHDLGKGRLEDHREVGLAIAANVARRLDLPRHEAEALKFLVHKHMLMNHLSFRRDTSDQQLVVQFAVQVGSPEMLQMLYILTAADLGAVGPDVWDGWKLEVVTDLYHRTMEQLAGASPETTVDDLMARRRIAIIEELGTDASDKWFTDHIQALPAAYLNATTAKQAADDLRLLHNRGASGVAVAGKYQPETATVQFTIAASENITKGIFYKLTGVLSSYGLQIREAQIHTLSDGLILDRFCVNDPDFTGEPPVERREQIEHALIRSLTEENPLMPTFRRTWQTGAHRRLRVPGVPTRVSIDNGTSQQFTIIDVFTHDRAGLLYAIAQTIFSLGLSVGRAKIGTFLDQVVDVFYVTDQNQAKIDDEIRLEEIRQRLLEVVESYQQT